MNANKSLAQFIAAGVTLSDTDKVADKIADKLFAASVFVIKGCDLPLAQRLWREHGGALDAAIKRMSLADQKAVSKRWNPHRNPPATKALQQDLTDELVRLACARMAPAPRPKPPNSPRPRSK